MQQTQAYAQAIGRASHWQTVLDGNIPVAHALTLRGPLGATTTLRGPVWPTDLDQSARTEVLRLLRLRLIEAETREPALRKAGFHAVTTPGCVAEWDLTQPAQTRRARMHGKWRNGLRRGESSGIRITRHGFEGQPDHPLLAQTTALAQARRYKTLPAHVTCAMASLVPGSACIFEARSKREVIAQMLFFHFGPVVTYHLGWSGPLGRQTNAHHLILTKAADHYAAKGVKRLDLGTIDTEAAPSLARFKIGTGAEIRPLGGAHVRLW